MNTTAPNGYDQKLWDSIPSVRAKKHPGKHDTYVFGQSSADGTACIGCSWQTHRVLTGPDAITQHDRDMGLTHDHETWVPLASGAEQGNCPCRSQSRDCIEDGPPKKQEIDMPSRPDTASMSGDPVHDEACPRCRHVGTIVYNGNYWCTRCPWVMAEGGRPKRIIAAYLRQERAKYLDRGDAENAGRMEFHLKELGVAVHEVPETPKKQSTFSPEDIRQLQKLVAAHIETAREGYEGELEVNAVMVPIKDLQRAQEIVTRIASAVE